MRILTWNINGVRTVPQYHPWNTLKTFDDILNYLEADIICFQEMKSSRQALPKQVALPPSYDSFFSFPIRKTGYSGTAIYTRRSSLVPLKAEEGLSGLLQPKPPFTPEERISAADSYPATTVDRDDLDYKDLDSEGRAVVVDLGLFVLINVYCPNDGTGTEERDKFKMNYHQLLETRVNGLIREGREVIVVGDLNACAAVEDHCEGRLMVERGLAEGLEGEDGFWGKDCRRWLRDWLVHENGGTGKMVDIVPKFWPDRKAMYTCWNTKISARDTNYGTRIDFVLVTPGLVPWVKGADIQPHIKGSDHCPVFIDFMDDITNVEGITTKLSDVLGAHSTIDQPAEPPRIAAKYWDEYKQKLLSNFFGKKGPKDCAPSQSSSKRQPSDSSAAADTPSVPISPNNPDIQTIQPYPSEPDVSTTPTTAKRKIVAESPKPHTKKVKTTSTSQDTLKSKGKEKKPAQPTLTGYFTKPKASTSKSASVAATSASSSSSTSKTTRSKVNTSLKAPVNEIDYVSTTEVDEDADYRLALALSQSEDSMVPAASSQESKEAWSTLLAPTQAPVCTVHREPAKEFTVNKPGPNKGKKFFICSRPVGPGYDKGRSERLREQVDPQWKCDFFKWSSEVRKEMSRSGTNV